MSNRSFIRGLYFHYSLDAQHSFARYYADIRDNILMIAYVWMAGFPMELIYPEAIPLVEQYLRAWMMTLPNDAAGSRHERMVSEQDAFVELWKRSDFDLIYFKRNQSRLVSRLLRRFLDRIISAAVKEKIKEKSTRILKHRNELSDEE